MNPSVRDGKTRVRERALVSTHVLDSSGVTQSAERLFVGWQTSVGLRGWLRQSREMVSSAPCRRTRFRVVRFSESGSGYGLNSNAPGIPCVSQTRTNVPLDWRRYTAPRDLCARATILGFVFRGARSLSMVRGKVKYDTENNMFISDRYRLRLWNSFSPLFCKIWVVWCLDCGNSWKRYFG